MRLPVVSTAKLGMIADVPPSELPLEAWSYTMNLDIVDGALVPAKGAPVALTLTEVPEILLAVVTTAQRYLLAVGPTEAILHTTGSTFDITPSGGVSGGQNTWTAGYLGSVPVLCDGTNAPYMWNPQSTGTLLDTLDNWPADHLCGGIRSFQGYLIAFDITKSGVRYPHLITWSHPADPGAIPISWDISNPTYDAGEYALLDTPGYIIDGLAMRAGFVVFKEDSIYIMRYIGGALIFRFDRLVSETGVFSKNCAANVGTKADQQVVWTRDNIILHNGTDSQGLLNGRMQRWLFSQIEPSASAACFVTRVPLSKEVWFCYPSIGETVPNRALVWNWEHNTLAPREIPSSTCAVIGEYSFSAGMGETWSTDTALWSDDSTSWDERLFNVTTPQCLLGGQDENLYWVGAGPDWSWGIFRWVAERVSLPVGADAKGNLTADPLNVKRVTEIWPRLQLPTGGVAQVSVGFQFSWSDPIVWEATAEFNPEESMKCDTLTAGRLISLRFSGETRNSTKFLGYDLNIEMLGIY